MADLAAHPSSTRNDLRFTVIRQDSTKIEVRIVDDDNHQIHGIINDMSASGMRLLLDEKIAVGMIFEIKLLVEELGIQSEYRATVRWSQPRDGQSWWTGCALEDPIPDEELDHMAAAGILNRRQDDRYETDFPAIVNLGLSSEPVPVIVKNYSLGGCCIECTDYAGELSERVLLVADKGDSEHPCSTRISLRVMWSNRHDKGLSVGCSFVSREGYPKLKRMIEKDGRDPKKTEPNRNARQPNWRWIAITTFVLLTLQIINIVQLQVYLSRPAKRGQQKVNSNLAPKKDVPDAANVDREQDFRNVSEENRNDPNI